MSWDMSDLPDESFNAETLATLNDAAQEVAEEAQAQAERDPPPLTFDPAVAERATENTLRHPKATEGFDPVYFTDEDES